MFDVFVDELDLGSLGFVLTRAATGRPAYHLATLLKLYIYGYLNRVPSSRRLEREAQRNVELMWLTGKLAPPMAGAGAGLHRHHAPRLLGEERQQSAAAQLLAEHDGARRIGSVRLEHGLRDIQADGGNVSHGRLPRVKLNTSLRHADAVGGVHPITRP